MSSRIPHHPGETLLEDCIEALGLTIAEAAAHLRVDEQDLAAICECRAPVTAEMAIRFAQAFGSTAEMWLRMQAAHDLGQAPQQSNIPNVTRLGTRVTPHSRALYSRLR